MRRTKVQRVLAVGVAVAVSTALTAGIMEGGAAAQNVQADMPERTFRFIVNDERARKARIERFRRDLAGIGVSRPIVNCDFLLVASSTKGPAYGAWCHMHEGTKANQAVMCNNDRLETFALTTTFAPTAEWVAAFARENCGDGAFDSTPDENGNTAF